LAAADDDFLDRGNGGNETIRRLGIINDSILGGNGDDIVNGGTGSLQRATKLLSVSNGKSAQPCAGITKSIPLVEVYA